MASKLLNTIRYAVPQGVALFMFAQYDPISERNALNRLDLSKDVLELLYPGQSVS